MWTNDGTGTFSSNASYAVGNGAQDVIAADVNGDGKPDLICANADDGTLSVLTNDGHGMFSMSSTNAAGRLPFCVVAADANGDHKLDLITVNYGEDSVIILTNTGSGLFASNASYAIAGGAAWIAAADVNGDGSTDLIIAGGDATVLTNNGIGAFTVDTMLPTTVPGSDGFGAQYVTAADLKGDGHMDVICVDFNDFGVPGTMLIFTNNGFGLCPNPQVVQVGEGPNCVAAADLNGDGQLDLVTANHLVGTLSVLISVPELTIKPAGSGVSVMWPSAWTNWVLSQSADLMSTNWSLSSGISDDTTNKSLFIERPTGNLFFRLAHP